MCFRAPKRPFKGYGTASTPFGVPRNQGMSPLRKYIGRACFYYIKLLNLFL